MQTVSSSADDGGEIARIFLAFLNTFSSGELDTDNARYGKLPFRDYVEQLSEMCDRNGTTLYVDFKHLVKEESCSRRTSSVCSSRMHPWLLNPSLFNLIASAFDCDMCYLSDVQLRLRTNTARVHLVLFCVISGSTATLHTMQYNLPFSNMKNIFAEQFGNSFLSTDQSQHGGIVSAKRTSGFHL